MIDRPKGYPSERGIELLEERDETMTDEIALVLKLFVATILSIVLTKITEVGEDELPRTGL